MVSLSWVEGSPGVGLPGGRSVFGVAAFRQPAVHLGPLGVGVQRRPALLGCAQLLIEVIDQGLHIAVADLIGVVLRRREELVGELGTKIQGVGRIASSGGSGHGGPPWWSGLRYSSTIARVPCFVQHVYVCPGRWDKSGRNENPCSGPRQRTVHVLD